MAKIFKAKNYTNREDLNLAIHKFIKQEYSKNDGRPPKNFFNNNYIEGTKDELNRLSLSTSVTVYGLLVSQVGKLPKADVPHKNKQKA